MVILREVKYLVEVNNLVKEGIDGNIMDSIRMGKLMDKVGTNSFNKVQLDFIDRTDYWIDKIEKCILLLILPIVASLLVPKPFSHNYRMFGFYLIDVMWLVKVYLKLSLPSKLRKMVN